VRGLVLVVILVGAWGAGVRPLQGAQQRSPAQHARAGWEAIDAGDAQQAQGHFAEALRGAPTEPTVLLGAGLAAHLLGQADNARRFLVDALKYQPSLTAAALLLGEVLYRANDIQGATQTYEQALVHAPEHAVLAKRLAEWRKESALHDRFAQKLGDHFTVLFEGPAEAALAARAVEILEAAYWRIGSALYTYPADVITVVLYTREQFRDVTQSPGWAGGAFDGRIRVPVRGALEELATFERVLTHEYTHAVVGSLAPRGVPQWLNEGLAMYFEGGDLSAQVEHARNAERPHPLTALERSFANMDGNRAALAYAQSAAAVKRLMDDAGAPAIVSILTDLGRGLPFADAFQRHANVPYADFQR
jgi:tetratricopeptide (TPR) repeat protein